MNSASPDAMNRVPTRRERFADVLRLIARESPAHDAQEAWRVLDEAFAKIEGHIPGQHMYVRDLSAFGEIVHLNTKIRVDDYQRHVLLLGENGSIDVREKNIDAGSSENLAHPYANLKPVLEKVGADGRYVWDAPTS